MITRPAVACVLVVGSILGLASTAEHQPQQLEPFRGVTTNGTVREGLFPIQATGVSTAPVARAAERFLASLTPDQRTKVLFPAADDEWRRWNNVHRAARQGVSLGEMSDAQREQAFALLGASLSARGLEKSRNVMRLNHTLAELVNNFQEYGDGLYWLTIMGTPSPTEPWGWQLDGHHLDINYFVLGDQVVMTPTFMGSEPVIARSGKYAGTVVLQEEQNKGFALMQALSAEQRAAATIGESKTQNNALSQAYRDNLVLDYAGLKASTMSVAQRELLLGIVREFVGNLSDGHARVRMREVEQHLHETYFAWIGGVGPNEVFYYRVQSPVILIEFDHQSPVALVGRGGPPTREHVHAVVRTPNGNDYGKDLLRQHYARHADDAAHGHAR
jgi:predicted nuclease of restriction endonuclease-like (RecB) superfamily